MTQSEDNRHHLVFKYKVLKESANRINSNQPEDEEALMQLLETPYQLEPPINRLKRAEVQEVINRLNPNKSSGYDLITGNILKELPTTGIKYLTQLFNAVLLKGYFPAQWKVAQIILILKLGKPPNELIFYRPISFLAIVSKVLEKLLHNRTDTSNRAKDKRSS
jgi:hypothetical protein